ncbi:DUF2087 domain-containing protein [Phenylobacterium sp.]|uniref:DUF2087 domain-containing protein n=1 Tax=Phenylobacterium sp. TaxID=1871053 RepID=UPI00286B540A|nr:DUF2087 domain-containing protein [Phenylobacterium sp.]
MSRTTIPFGTQDVSAFAKALRAQLLSRDAVPGHVELLNMLARAGGRRNFQDLRANAPPTADEPPIEVADPRVVERVRRCFGPEGRLTRWPAKRSDQLLALWGIWSRVPARVEYSEQQFSQVLRGLHDFGDHALLRRDMSEAGLMFRSPDCRIYRRIERIPPPTAMALISAVQPRPAQA